MNTKKLFATVAISTMLLTACTFNQKDTIIKVNDKNITQSQFDKEMDKALSNSIFAQMGVDVKNDKNNSLYLMMKDKVVNELIVKSLVNGEIEKRNIKVTKDDVNAELKTIIDKVGSKEKFDQILKQNGISSDQFMKDLTEEVKMKKLVGMLSSAKVSDAEVKKFYDQNISKFKNPDKVRASHILIAANPEELTEKLASDPANKGMSKDAIKAKVDAEIAAKLKIAQSVLADVKKDPASFSKIAKAKSEDKASAEKGGDLGFFAKTEMVEPFSKVAFSQKPNTISEIVKTPYGFHIILVTDRKQAGQEPFAKVKGEISMYLENQNQVKVLDNLIESLKKQAKIEYVNPEFNPTSIQEKLKQQEKMQMQQPGKGQPAGQTPPPPPAPVK